jgi:hypothetical protein
MTSAGRCMKSGFIAGVAICVRRILMDDVQLGKGVPFVRETFSPNKNERFATILWQPHEFTPK